MQECEAVGIKQLSKYKTFVDKIRGVTDPLYCKKTQCHKIVDILIVTKGDLWLAFI
jgi:hypothetical protein